MNLLSPSVDVLPGVLVPRTLIARPEAFRGVAIGDCLHGDLVMRGGNVAGLEPPSAGPAGLVMPRLTEPHVHLDKCHTVDRIGDVSGDLEAAIAAQRADKLHWTEADIRARAWIGLNELAAAGCGAVRSHVDWGAPADGTGAPLAWEVLRELAQAPPGRMTVQLAALTSIDELAEPDVAEAVARRVAADGGVLGSFVLGQPARGAGIRAAFAMAARHDLALDFHVDEGLDAALDGVELIAGVALEYRLQTPVLIGHACGLISKTGDALRRVAETLARAGVAVAALPATNLYLQGRCGATPERRGLTRVHELAAAGVNVVLGTDNVRDAFCPIGRHDPRQTLALAVLAAHLDPPTGNHLAMISTGAQQALGLAPVTVDGAAIGDVLLYDVRSTSAFLSGTSAPVPLAEALKREGA